MSTTEERTDDAPRFDRADFASTDAPTQAPCVACGKPLPGSYFEVNGKIVCPACHELLAVRFEGGSGAGRFLKATALGLLGGAVGSAIWIGVRTATGWEIGIVAIVVGLLVGNAVRMGSGDRGGLAYQLLAVGITYAAITSTYVPIIIEAIRENGGGDGAGSLAGYVIAWTVILCLAAAAPFLAGFQNVIGILIIGFALYEAWRRNRRVAFVITGPYALTGAGSSTA